VNGSFTDVIIRSHQVRDFHGQRAFKIAVYEEIISEQNASKSMKRIQKMLEVVLKNKVARFLWARCMLPASMKLNIT
jgi:hypothetical protein